MITPTVELALLSLYVYAVGDELNRPKLPPNWTPIQPSPTGPVPDNGVGFSYVVVKNAATQEIVISFAGTNQPIDWPQNFTNGLGLSSPQAVEAAKVYSRVRADNPSAQILSLIHI